MKWIEIPRHYLSKTSEIRLVELPEKSFCLVWNEDQWVAFSKKCPHAGASLENGWCEGKEVVCPYHRHRFNLIDGRGAIGQGNYIQIYPLKEVDDILYVGLKENIWSRIFG
ncbi:Rieske (2Fe-2S) protein [Sphingobacterium pedocola]|uniref:Nitrite reductase n=1 Tax=Sphingobacterium pedocola TaxID=2082722 RepID=A0ABR9T6F6_9SPHI|nr:Rieske (2Fe-2S) protein [Sphingobacterium pedocola]MBE8720932.1 nitrite reductase [Sphingobacterium pedocola]